MQTITYGNYSVGLFEQSRAIAKPINLFFLDNFDLGKTNKILKSLLTILHNTVTE